MKKLTFVKQGPFLFAGYATELEPANTAELVEGVVNGTILTTDIVLEKPRMVITMRNGDTDSIGLEPLIGSPRFLTINGSVDHKYECGDPKFEEFFAATTSDVPGLQIIH